MNIVDMHLQVYHELFAYTDWDAPIEKKESKSSTTIRYIPHFVNPHITCIPYTIPTHPSRGSLKGFPLFPHSSGRDVYPECKAVYLYLQRASNILDRKKGNYHAKNYCHHVGHS